MSPFSSPFSSFLFPPGTPSGVNYGNLFLTGIPVLNNAGQTAFVANLTGTGVDNTNNLGIWLEESGILKLVSRRGNQAPGTPGGVNFASIGSGFVLNDAGQIAFLAALTGSGVDSTNDLGIWATDRSGDLQLVAREGDLLEVAPGDFRTISAFYETLNSRSTGNSDGRRSQFNNRGQLVFRASFTDGTQGIFVSNRVAIPEPSSLALAAVAATLLALGRLRRRSW